GGRGSACAGGGLPATQHLETMLIEMLVAAIRVVVPVRGVRRPERRIQAPPYASLRPRRTLEVQIQPKLEARMRERDPQVRWVTIRVENSGQLGRVIVVTVKEQPDALAVRVLGE